MLPPFEVEKGKLVKADAKWQRLLSRFEDLVFSPSPFYCSLLSV